ncbi:MAG: 3-hydroxybutyryl-CoA dehydratase [Gaiellales bacterium]|jgi:3-hydroxybutyryl-CoA dehydratase|nr:3-hydroxybutyryl-CoA dehydratase [Gaiellales bacterium]MDX6599407.1 3-hydroxybutyryl-CoA dehydratase [Gaiellales bacterium]
MAIAVGQRAVQEFLVDDRTIELFGEASTDRNPLHFDDEFGRQTPFGGRIAHGMVTAAFISAIIGNELPGHGSVYLGQTLKFRAPVRPGDTVRVEVEVLDYDQDRRGARLSTRAYVGDTLVVDGEAKVIAPA